MKCPGGRWVNNGWLEVEDMLPLMKPTFDRGVYPFVYLDVGCKLGEETTFVLKQFPGAQVVALEMRPEFAKKCEHNSIELAADRRQVTVLNKAAALSPGSGSFIPKMDASSISMPKVSGHAQPGSSVSFKAMRRASRLRFEFRVSRDATCWLPSTYTGYPVGAVALYVSSTHGNSGRWDIQASGAQVHGGTSIEFVTLDSVWEEYIAPKKVRSP
eukprot:6248306-Pyramimonas_sp.AAC.2